MLSIPWGIDYASVIVGVLTGALFGCRRKFDVVGTTVLGFLTGYGGGIVRDLLLGGRDIYFMAHTNLIWLSLGICLATFYFRGLFLDLDRFLFAADTMSVALFALAGASKAVAYGFAPVYVVLLGTITAVGGGALRDSFAGVPPAIFRQSNYYALACVAGSVVFSILAYVQVPLWIAGIACVVSIIALRYLSVHFGWQTQDEADFTPRLKSSASRAARVVYTHAPSVDSLRRSRVHGRSRSKESSTSRIRHLRDVSSRIRNTRSRVDDAAETHEHKQ